MIGGSGLLALVLGPEERPRRVVWRAVLLASLGLVLATLVWAAATAAQSVGSGLDGLLRWAPLQDVFGTSFGQAWVARIALAAALAGTATFVLVRRRSGSAEHVVAAVLAAGIALTFALAGHARVAGPSRSSATRRTSSRPASGSAGSRCSHSLSSRQAATEDRSPHVRSHASRVALVVGRRVALDGRLDTSSSSTRSTSSGRRTTGGSSSRSSRCSPLSWRSGRLTGGSAFRASGGRAPVP